MNSNNDNKENLKNNMLTNENIPNHKVEFVHIPGKELMDTIENFDNFDDIDLGSMNEKDMEKIIKKEKKEQMNDEELLNYLLKNEEVDKEENEENNIVKNNGKKDKDKVNKMKELKKIDEYLEKRTKKLEIIQEKIDEEKNKNKKRNKISNQNNNNSNNSNIINKRNKSKLRTFEEFIKSQKSHIEKVKEKISKLKNEQKKVYDDLCHKIPEICDNSKKIMEKNNKKVVDRLYNSKKELPTSNTQDTLISASTRLSKDKQKYLFNLYNDAQKRKEKIKEKENEIYNQEIMNSSKITQNSNKILYKKFKDKFQNEINNNIDIFDNSIGFKDLEKLFINLRFVKGEQISNEESNLLNEIYECLINDSEIENNNNNKNTIPNIINNYSSKINLDHLYIFCLSIIGLLNYYILNSYTNTDKKLTENGILLKINEDLNSKIKINKKYGGFDEDKNFIITPNQSKLIFSHFFIFYQNWKSTFTVSKKIQNHESLNFLNNNINISQNNKPLRTNNNKSNITNHKSYYSNTEGNLFQHINQSLLRKIETEKNLNEQKKKKEEEEMANCTFMPKINKYKNDDNIISLENIVAKYNLTEKDIFKKEKAIIQKSEYEKKQKEELTFKPKINNIDNIQKYYSENKVPIDEFIQDEENFAKRLENGRKERALIDNAFKLRNYNMKINLTKDNKNLERNKSVGRLTNVTNYNRYSFKPKKKIYSQEKNYLNSNSDKYSYSGNFDFENKSTGFKNFQKKKSIFFIFFIILFFRKNYFFRCWIEKWS